MNKEKYIQGKKTLKKNYKVWIQKLIKQVKKLV